MDETLKLLQLYKGSEINRGRALSAIINKLGWKETTIGLLLKKGATEEEANDIFYDGLLDFTENVLLKKFRGESKLQTYFISICKLKYFKYKERNKTPPTEPLDFSTEKKLSNKENNHRRTQ